ncbi:hypothetical protein Taro_019227 [Colocasia esculenta]|uniref:Uncharacterized protein n=1 Tax=Colocasia esculenta TaxID=4460 RepID=A0A843UYK4_COLES|nr:hypothetical protein [Colocasia esculenta]
MDTMNSRSQSQILPQNYNEHKENGREEGLKAMKTYALKASVDFWLELFSLSLSVCGVKANRCDDKSLHSLIKLL